MARENHAKETTKHNSQSNSKQDPEKKCAITKDIFNSEAKFRVKDMLCKALQLQQSRLNIVQSENMIDLDDTMDFKEAPRFKRSLRLKNKNTSSSSVTSLSDVIVIDAENESCGLVQAHKFTVQLPHSSEDKISVKLPQSSEDKISVKLPQSSEDKISVKLPQSCEDKISVTLPQSCEDKNSVKLPQNIEDKNNDKLPKSNKDKSDCGEFTLLKNIAVCSEKEGAVSTASLGLTDEVKDDCRVCLVCGQTFDLLDFKRHSIDCLKQNFSKPDKNKGLIEGITAEVKCHVCNKNITYLNSQRRQQHVNQCIDKEDATKQEEIEHQRQIEVAKTAVLNCPMCGKKFKVQSSRQSHLKKCALSHKMTVEQVKNLVKQQEEEYQSKLDAGILPEDFLPVKLKPLQGKNATSSRLKSQFDEDTQLALALSTSLAEGREKEDLTFNGLFGNTNFDRQAAQCSKVPGKNKKAKLPETTSLLVSLSREDAMKRISDRITRYTFPPNQEDSRPTTPPFKTAQDCELKSSAASSSVKSCIQSQPDWWFRTSLTMSTEDRALTELSSTTSSGLSYYVKELMPPVSESSVAAGSKVKRVSCIPGRRRSGEEMQQHHDTVGPWEMGQYPDVVRSREMKQGTGIVSLDRLNTGLPTRVSPIERFVSQATTSSPLSQTVEVLTRLAMESDRDQNDSICSQLPDFQPDVTDDSDGGEFTIEPSGFCRNSRVKVQSDSKDITTSYLGLVNCPSFSDLVVMTDKGAEVYAHKIVLHARCPELLSMSVKKDGRDVVDLTAFSQESVLCFLKFVYAGQATVDSTCQADVNHLAERFSMAELKAATSNSDVGSFTDEDLQETGMVTTGDSDVDCREREDRNERNTFDDDDWLDVFQTQRDNFRLKSGETAVAVDEGDAQSGGDNDMDEDGKEGEEKHSSSSFNDGEFNEIFQTQKDNIDSSDHGSRVEQSEEITEEVKEEVDNVKLSDMTNKCGYNASFESLKMESDDDELFSIEDKQCSATECDNGKESKGGYVVDVNDELDTEVFVDVNVVDVNVVDVNDGLDTDVFVCEEKKVQMLPQTLSVAENNESRSALAQISNEDEIMILDKKDVLDNMLFKHELFKTEVSSLGNGGGESEHELALAPHETQHNVIETEITGSESERSPHETQPNVIETEITESEGKRSQDLTSAPLETQQNFNQNKILSERERSRVLTPAPLETQQFRLAGEIQQDVVKHEITSDSSEINCLETSSTSQVGSELSGIHQLENTSTDEINLESSRTSVLENSAVNDIHLNSNMMNILENSSLSCANLSTDDSKNALVDKKATTAGGCKKGQKKKKKTRVSVKEFKNIVHKALSGFSDPCQPLPDLTDEEINKIGIKIEQGLQDVSDPNDSVYIPSVLEDTGESTNEVIVTHADIKTTPKKNRKQGKKPQTKAQTMSSLFVELSQTVGASSLVTQSLSVDYNKLALQSDFTQAPLQHGRIAAQKSKVVAKMPNVAPQTITQCSSISASTSHDETSRALQAQYSKTTATRFSPLKANSGRLYLASLLQKSLTFQTQTSNSRQSLNNSTVTSENGELVSKEHFTPRTLSDGLQVRAPPNPCKALEDTSFDVHEDVLRSSQLKDPSTVTSSSNPMLISPSAKSTNSGYISGEELFTDSEEDLELTKTQLMYRSPSDPLWTLSMQQISSSPAKEDSLSLSMQQISSSPLKEDSVDTSIMQEVSLVRRNIFLQEFSGNTGIKTATSAERSTSDSRSSSDVETPVAQSLTNPSTVGNTVQGTRLQNDKEAFIFKHPHRKFTSSKTWVSDNPNSASVGSTQVDILIDLSLHLLRNTDSGGPSPPVSVGPGPVVSLGPAISVKNANAAADASDEDLFRFPSISSLKTSRNSNINLNKITDLAASPETNTSQIPETLVRHSKTTAPVKRSQSPTAAHSRKDTDSQIRSEAVVTSKTSSVETLKPSLVKLLRSDNSLDLPAKNSTSCHHLEKPEPQKSTFVTQSLQTVITSPAKPSSPRKHLNTMQNMDGRSRLSKNASSISRFSTAVVDTQRLVPVPLACAQRQSSSVTAKLSGPAKYRSDSPEHVGCGSFSTVAADCRSNSGDNNHTHEDTVAGRTINSAKFPISRTLAAIDSNSQLCQIKKKPVSEQSILMHDDDDYGNIPAIVMSSPGQSSCEKGQLSTDKALSDGNVLRQMVGVSGDKRVNLTKFKESLQEKASLAQESDDSSDLDSPLPLRMRLGLTNPFQRAVVRQPVEIKETAPVTFPKTASMPFLNPQSSIGTQITDGQNKINCTSKSNKDKEFDDDDDLLFTNEAHFESMQFLEQTDNPKTPKQQTLKRQKNVRKAGKVPSPFTPMAPYDDMATPDLKKAVSKIGVRPLGKKRMREFLKRVYHETHQYETDSDYDGTPVKRQRSSYQSLHLSPKAMLSHLPIRAAGRSYTQARFQPTNKAKSNKVNQTEKKDRSVAVVKQKLTSSSQKSTSQMQETLEGRSLGKSGLISDDCVLEDADVQQQEVSGSQDSSFSSDGPDLPEESILQGWPEEDVLPSNQVQSNQQTVTERLVQFVKSNQDIYESILMYEPLELDILKKRIADSGIKVSMANLMDFLDDRFITFTMKNMGSRNNNRHRRVQKSGKSPSKSKALSQR